MMIKERKMKKSDSHAKSSTISMVLFRNVSLSIGKSTTVTIFIGRETKTHIFPTKIDEKTLRVSPSYNNYSFRIM